MGVDDAAHGSGSYSLRPGETLKLRPVKVSNLSSPHRLLLYMVLVCLQHWRGTTTEFCKPAARSSQVSNGKSGEMFFRPASAHCTSRSLTPSSVAAPQVRHCDMALQPRAPAAGLSLSSLAASVAGAAPVLAPPGGGAPALAPPPSAAPPQPPAWPGVEPVFQAPAFTTPLIVLWSADR